MDDLSIIFPVYNEKDTLESVLSEWQKELNKNKISYRFIVCEDGSTDGTKELVKKLQKKYKLIVSQKKERRGYGKAIIDGLLIAKSKYILSLDSDGQCSPTDFLNFWKARDRAEIIIGWRKKRTDPKHRKLFSWMFLQLFRFLFPSTIHDPSAPFLLYKRKIIRYVKYFKYLNEGFWWGFIGLSIKKNISIYELPINHRLRDKGKSQIYFINKICSSNKSCLFSKLFNITF